MEGFAVQDSQASGSHSQHSHLQPSFRAVCHRWTGFLYLLKCQTTWLLSTTWLPLTAVRPFESLIPQETKNAKRCGLHASRPLQPLLKYLDCLNMTSPQCLHLELSPGKSQALTRTNQLIQAREPMTSLFWAEPHVRWLVRNSD